MQYLLISAFEAVGRHIYYEINYADMETLVIKMVLELFICTYGETGQYYLIGD